MAETYYIVPESQHNALTEAVYRHRGFLADEAADGARLCAEATRHGIRTHNAIKALHLDHLFGSGSKGCVPGARIEEVPTRFAATRVWNANRKLGQSTAYRAMDAAIALADRYGIGTVSVDNAFHYLWGGGYVMDAARRGYIAYTNCTAALAEVVPFGGKFPTLGTNPHSWGFPTTSAVGYPIVIDWATSVIAMGRVQQLRREGLPLPPNGRPGQDGQPDDRPPAGGLAPALRRAQGLRPVSDQRDRRRLHRRLAPNPAQPLGNRAVGEALLHLLLPGHPSRRPQRREPSRRAATRPRTSRP